MLSEPDSSWVSRLCPSPNHGERKGGCGIDMLVLHYTGCPSCESALLWMLSPDAEVSAHYLVDEDGEIIQLVAEERRAWHAGLSCWDGETDVNSRSIGIEIQNAGHLEDPPPPYPEKQIAAVIALVEDIVRRHDIAPWRVVGHSDIAPDRKADPGEHFPWDCLGEAGLCLHVPSAPLNLPGEMLKPGDSGPGVRALQRDLARLGYGLAETGDYDETTWAVVRAFQRRFRPARIDGLADPSTRETLNRALSRLASMRRVW